MNRTAKFAILATVTATFIGGAALAGAHKEKRENRGDRAEQMFERMDADKDAKVTLEEMKAHAAERFARRDVDGDGIVSREDRQAFRKANREERRGARFDKMDADSDGMISKEEFAAFTPERGDRAERGERRGMRGDRAERRERGERGERRGMRGHQRGERMGKGNRRGMRGPLTIQEVEARATQRFERIDSDDKGYITLNDIKAFRADRKDRRRGHN